ncbi:MAG: DnaJ domain-containing protein [Aureispira sp.]
MRDYYYTLGVNHSASLSEIQQAYKKLSLKFHPEKNGNDPFYTLHYEKVKEAYEILSDDHRRFRYDKAIEKQRATERKDNSNAPPPTIAAFFASKNSVKKGDIITISWEVFNAEKIRINLIGEVASNGTQTIRLTVPAAHEPYLYVELEASNTSSIQSSRKRLSLKNTAYNAGLATSKLPSSASDHQHREAIEPAAQVIENTPTEEKRAARATKKSKKRIPKKVTSMPNLDQQRNAWAAYILVVLLFFMIAVMLYTIFLINPVF